MRALIVNADDFGRSPGINRGIVHAYERGIVTSASLMVRAAAAVEAARYARADPALSVGLHVDLDGRSPGDDVGAEVADQLDAFRALVGRDPTHLDTHHHAHRHEPARSALVASGIELNVPVRHFAAGIASCGEFYGARQVTVQSLHRILEALPDGTIELMCHPAAEVDFESSYAEERLRELETLCDPRPREAIERLGIELVSFAEVRPRVISSTRR